MSRLRRREYVGYIGALTGVASTGCQFPGATDSETRDLEISNRILYIDEEPLLLTGIYYWPDISYSIGRNPIEEISEYGFNVLTARYQYIRLDEKRVDGQPSLAKLRETAEQLGLYYLLESPPPDELKGMDDAELESVFSSLVDRVADSSRFLGWTFDEPVWRGIDLELIRRCTKAIREHDVDQLIYFVYAPVDERWSDGDWPDMEMYSSEADVVGHTFYPIDPGLPWEGYIGRNRLEDYGWYTDQVKRWIGTETPIWLHQQGHRVGDLENPPTEAGRRPNRVETRFMSFQALVHGAIGIFYFPGSKLGSAIPFDSPVWDEFIRETAAELRSLETYLPRLRGNSSITVDTSSTQTLSWFDGTDGILLAVREEGGRKISVGFDSLDMVDGIMHVHKENRDVSVSNGSFEDEFEAFDVHLYHTPGVEL